MLDPGDLAVPIVLAPLAGGAATVGLAAAVSDAGGLGFLAAGYLSAGAVREQIDGMGTRVFGVNVFVPSAAPVEDVTAYAARLAAEGEVGAARADDDDWEAKLVLLRETAPPVVSFTFGLPDRALIADLRGRGSAVWVTVTSAAEGEAAVAAGADALVAQGAEAGGHRGGFTDDGDAVGTLALLQVLSARVTVPLIAAGGVTTGAGLAAVLAAGASAGAVGTGFLRATEAGTNPAHRAALATPAPTALTRAFTGRSARGIVNAFMRRHDAAAPRAYPAVHHLTAPRRAQARAAGDPDDLNLWAGQAHELAREAPAAEIVAELMAGARAAAYRAADRLG